MAFYHWINKVNVVCQLTVQLLATALVLSMGLYAEWTWKYWLCVVWQWTWNNSYRFFVILLALRNVM